MKLARIISDAFKFGGEQKLQLKEAEALPAGERATLRIITQNRRALTQLTAILPDESKVIMSSLRQFSGTQPLYTLADDGTLTNSQSGVKYRANNDIGYYQAINADGSWGNEKLSRAIPLPSVGTTSPAYLPTKAFRNRSSPSLSGRWSSPF